MIQVCTNTLYIGDTQGCMHIQNTKACFTSIGKPTSSVPWIDTCTKWILLAIKSSVCLSWWWYYWEQHCITHSMVIL